MGADPTAVISMIRAFAAALATRRRERDSHGVPPIGGVEGT
jgi:hypothetical protein